MIKRRIEKVVQDGLQRNPSVALIGPWQVGKTTTALNISESTPCIYLDLQSRLDLEKVRDIVAFHQDNSDKLIILDEVQKLPEVFVLLRGIIDKERRNNYSQTLKFILFDHIFFVGQDIDDYDVLKEEQESVIKSHLYFYFCHCFFIFTNHIFPENFRFVYTMYNFSFTN